jgi:hypothetical protein
MKNLITGLWKTTVIVVFARTTQSERTGWICKIKNVDTLISSHQPKKNLIRELIRFSKQHVRTETNQFAQKSENRPTLVITKPKYLHNIAFFSKA